MREHQIVFNLKREQFEEAQRLARLSGAQSVNAFIRERVLAFLGIESKEPFESSDATPPPAPGVLNQNLSSVKEDLTRIHRELQVFIAEALGTGVYSEQAQAYVADFEESDYEPSLMEQTFYAFQELQKAIDLDLQQMKAELEENDTTSGESSKQLLSVPNLFLDEDSMAAQQKEAPAPLPDYKRAVDYLQSAGTFNMAPGNPSAAGSVFIGPTYVGGNPLLPQGDQSSKLLEHEHAATDELEDLADRAFAISPRLGSFSEHHEDEHPPTQPAAQRKQWEPTPAPAQDDPLQDLIDDSIIEQAEKQRQAYAASEARVEEDRVPQPEKPATQDVIYAPLGDGEEDQDSETDELSSTITEEEQQDESDVAEAGEKLAGSIKNEDSAPTSRAEEDKAATNDEEDDDDDEDDNDASATRTVPPKRYTGTTTGEQYRSRDPDAPLPGPPPKRTRPHDNQGISGAPPPKKRKK